jgi:hypothetical protein
MRYARWKTLSVLALVLSAASCADTQLTSTWRDATVAPVRFKNMLAVAMVTRADRRHAVEDRMVADIRARGVDATPSYMLISNDDTRNAAAVRAAVEKGGFDGALTWRTIAITDETHYVPGNHSGFWFAYEAGWANAYDPGYLQTDRVIRVETRVYLVTPSSDRLIWQGKSRTVDASSLDELVDSVVDASAESMQDAHMFASRR